MNDVGRQQSFEKLGITADLRTFSHKHYAYKVTAIIILMYFAGGIFASIIQYSFFDENSVKIFSIYSQGVLQLLLILVPTIYFAKKALLPVSILFRKNYSINFIQVVSGILGIFAFQLFATGFTIIQEKIIPDFLLSYYKEIENVIENMYTNILGGTGYLDMSRALLIGALIPAISEESLFRGFLQTSLEQDYKPLKAILITSIIFSVIHINPIGFIPLLFIGLYLGFIAYSSGNLILPIIVHFVNNAVAIFVIFSPALSEMDKSSSDFSLFIGIIMALSGIIVVISCSYVILLSSEKIMKKNI